jgi:hypothetical protein
MNYEIARSNGDYVLSLNTKLHPYTDASYEYEPLFLPLPNRIRLLTLHPRSDDSSELELSINNLPFGIKGYCALSYTWGDPSNQKEIRLNGHKFKVNENLFDALIALAARLDSPSPFWIDAICINQDDLAERAEQVKVMRDIFANAGYVLAWIGKRGEDDELGFTLMEGIVERLDRDDKVQGPIVKLSEDIINWLMQGLENPYLERMWNALSDILNRSWWNRAWIVQEIAVSQKSYLMCGDLLIDFSDVFRACTAIYMYEVLAMTQYGNAGRPVDLQRGKAIIKHPNLGGGARKASMLSTEYAYQKYRTLIGPTASEEDLHEKSGLPISTFFDILWRFANKQSTDPRDKIYAYMGMVVNKEEIDRIQVDYEMSIPKLYRQVVRAHIEVRKNLRVFDWFGGISRPEGFSSWAHDMTPETTPGADMFEVEELDVKWNSSLDLLPQATFRSHDDEDLILHGLVFDTIETVGDQFIEPCIVGTEVPSDELADQKGPNVYKAWQELAGITSFMKSVIQVKDDITRAEHPEQGAKDIVDTWMDAAQASGKYPSGQWKLDAFIQTVLMDPYQTEEYGKAYNYRGVALVNTRRSSPLAIIMFGEMLLGRRFFITKQGYFGLGPGTITTGDKVCILFGGATPHILRDLGYHHMLVGWSYVHGLMNGEAIQKMNDGELKEEEFLLQ